MTRTTDRLDAPWLDAALHLLDRQVVDRDDLMVCNVDDLEITEDESGTLAVTGILITRRKARRLMKAEQERSLLETFDAHPGPR